MPTVAPENKSETIHLRHLYFRNHVNIGNELSMNLFRAFKEMPEINSNETMYWWQRDRYIPSLRRDRNSFVVRLHNVRIRSSLITVHWPHSTGGLGGTPPWWSFAPPHQQCLPPSNLQKKFPVGKKWTFSPCAADNYDFCSHGALNSNFLKYRKLRLFWKMCALPPEKTWE